MNNVVVVGRLYAHGNLNCNAHGLLDGKPGLLFNIFFKGDPLHKLHDDIMVFAFFSHIVYIDNIGMHQTCRRLRLNPKLGHKVSVFAEFLL